MSWLKILLVVIGVVFLGGVGAVWYVLYIAELDIYVPLYADNCASCHGAQLQGTEHGAALVGRVISGGDSVAELVAQIKDVHPQLGLPAFVDTLSEVEIQGLAIFVGEQRLGLRFSEFQFNRAIDIPRGVLASEAHSFSIETVATGLDPLIFSIAPLPDGSLLVSEKERGLSIISADGHQSEVITGTPETGGSFDIRGLQYGTGWLLDVAIHPHYEQNRWVYLHYTHLCGDACDGLLPASMNRLDRGRIVDGKWVDVQTIWQAPLAYYTSAPDTGVGGRIAFDDSGHVYISVGIKSVEEGEGRDISAQDLNLPYGKIHRLRDDGSVPPDNPFFSGEHVSWEEAELTRQSIWTYGHRSVQGLEWHAKRKRMWISEMGARGGDEINELLPGQNYGWPYHSLGLEYSGIHVERYKQQALEFAESEVQQTLVNITPSPGISSFTFYSGDRFPGWQDDMLIGSLKGTTLFRMVFDGDQLVQREVLIKDLARIRDVETGFDGLVYLLLENKAGSTVVRLVPQETPQKAPQDTQHVAGFLSAES